MTSSIGKPPAWLKDVKAPTLVVGVEPAPKAKAEKIPRPNFDFKPVVYAPAIRRSGTDFMDPPWLLSGNPRPVQMEALRRSIKGFALIDGKDNVERFRVLRPVGFQPDKGFNYYMEMRLGKTYTILNDFYIQRFNHNVRWLVVFVPNFLKDAWTADTQAMADVPVMAYHAAKKRQFAEFIKANAATGGVLIVNYESSGSAELYEMLRPVLANAMFADDESIKLKNMNGATFKGVSKLTAQAHRVVNASGKPITQGPQDLLGQLHMAYQARSWRYPSFVSHFAEKGGHKGKQIVGAKHVEELQKLYMPRSFVARFGDWYDGEGAEYLPPIEVTLSPEQRKVMAELEEDMMVEIREDLTITAPQILSRNMKMQQVRSGFIYDNEGEAHVIIPWQKNPLFNDLLTYLREHVTHKAIIVGYYKPTMDWLEEALEEFNPAVIRSAEWHKEHERTIEGEKLRFNTDPGTRVMVAQESSLLYGHTLMGTHDDPTGVMIFFEQTYSLNDRSQSEKRPQGVGQAFPVAMVDFFASELDRARVLALQKKEDVAAVVLNFARDQGILPHSV